MAGEALRKLAIAAPGAGELTGPDVCCGSASHPVCGDQLEVTVRMAAGRVEAMRWRASACPATLAVAAASVDAVVGADATTLAAVVRARLASLGDLAPHERHAEQLLLRAMRSAMGAAG
ncbi:MAG: NifU-like terminal domain [Planctomycetota bacterium]